MASFFKYDSLSSPGCRGNDAFFTDLYHRFHLPLTRYGLRMLPDAFEVQTILQEVYLKAWQFQERLTTPEHWYRFCRMNLRWLCYKHYRKPSPVIYTFNFENISESPEEPPGQELEKILALTSFLSPRRKKILTLHYQEGISVKELAEYFHTSPQNIRLELQKAVSQLRQMLQVAPKPTFPVPERDCIWNLRKIQKRSFESIAAELNLPLATVQQQYIKMLSRA